MSRALDHEVAASVKSGNPQSVYNDIVAALCSPSSELLEIELLGKSHQLPDGCNLLIDRNSIAIPKVRLVQAFCYARQYFFQYQKDLRAETYQDLQNASAVMLLMDSEHLTAANLRKRLVRVYEKRSTIEFEEVLTRELLLIDSMLTSRLHRHTKSPTLWSHRRWLLEICQLNGMQRDLRRDLASVILVAAERHPRNYYAWSHLRWVVRNTGLKAQSNTKWQEPVIEPGVSPGTLLHDIKDWCIRRPGDISGWSFLLFYLLSSNLREQSPNIRNIEASSSICKEILGLATSFNWKHESVWVFLRTLVASGYVLEDERASFLEIIESKIAALSEATETRILQSSLDWYTKYRREL